MYVTKFWRLLNGRIEEAEHFGQLMCQTSEADRPCEYLPSWVVAWTVNESGLPGLGSSRVDYVCDNHLTYRLRRIPFRYAGTATVTPYKLELKGEQTA